MNPNILSQISNNLRNKEIMEQQILCISSISEVGKPLYNQSLSVTSQNQPKPQQKLILESDISQHQISQNILMTHQGSKQEVYQKRQCFICSQFIDMKLFIKLSKCSHQFCQSCNIEFAKQCIKNSKQVCCPAGCGAQLNEEANIQHYLPDQYAAKFRRQNFIRYTDSQGLKRCPRQKCQDGILILLSTSALECSSCFKRFCRKCQWPEHEGLCTKAAEDLIDNEFLFATCEKCNRKIQRNQGCNHMSCLCGYQFCYCCLKKWSHSHECPTLNKRRIKFDVAEYISIQLKKYPQLQQRTQQLSKLQNQVFDEILQTRVNVKAAKRQLEIQKEQKLRILQLQEKQREHRLEKYFRQEAQKKSKEMKDKIDKTLQIIQQKQNRLRQREKALIFMAKTSDINNNKIFLQILQNDYKEQNKISNPENLHKLEKWRLKHFSSKKNIKEYIKKVELAELYRRQLTYFQRNMLEVYKKQVQLPENVIQFEEKEQILIEKDKFKNKQDVDQPSQQKKKARSLHRKFDAKKFSLDKKQKQQ